MYVLSKVCKIKFFNLLKGFFHNQPWPRYCLNKLNIIKRSLIPAQCLSKILLLWKTWFWSHFGSSITQINVCLIKKRIKNMKCRKYPYNYKHLSHQSLIKAIIVRERDILMKFVCRYMHSNHENFNRFVFVFVYFAFTHIIIIILCTRMTFLLKS